MLTQSGDRRSRRSRRLLKEGLSQLLQEKKFSQISVRDITDRMDLNRGTFYLHYTDTYDLLQNLEQDVLGDIQTMINEHLPQTGGRTLRPIFEPLLDYTIKNRELCEALFINNASSDFMGRMHGLLFENGRKLIRAAYPDAPEEQMGFLLSYAALGAVGLLRRWFATGMREERERVLEMAENLTVSAARTLLGPMSAPNGTA